MTRNANLLITSISPVIWGSSYLITTEYLPAGYPLTVAMLRGLPVWLLLLLVVRQLPSGNWWLKILLLGGLNFSIFWWMLFESAYRLPGGIAATVGAIQPLIVIILARFFLGTSIRPLALVAAVIGICGIGILILTPQASLDPVGLAAGLVGALSMGLGTVLSRRWQPQVSLLTFTSWQLVAGGLLLLPAAMWFEPALPALTQNNLLGFIYLGLVGSALTYLLWFRGLSRLEPASVSMLGFLSPITAVAIGWLFLEQGLSYM
ncbi:EamA family transporter [Shewanella sp. SG41-4]|uniref:EamA family transporter n=1 Tax=Shewanella sp. SG41-4 TaxID=2760976 RepID=UPI0015FFBFDF|nr:EamA family transporter [Shewanella sp. SG41-4]MBB1438986.1 EamA family transporter [Shewanella sp. SG41-4]